MPHSIESELVQAAERALSENTIAIVMGSNPILAPKYRELRDTENRENVARGSG